MQHTLERAVICEFSQIKTEMRLMMIVRMHKSRNELCGSQLASCFFFFLLKFLILTFTIDRTQLQGITNKAKTMSNGLLLNSLNMPDCCCVRNSTLVTITYNQ